MEIAILTRSGGLKEVHFILPVQIGEGPVLGSMLDSDTTVGYLYLSNVLLLAEAHAEGAAAMDLPLNEPSKSTISN